MDIPRADFAAVRKCLPLEYLLVLCLHRDFEGTLDNFQKFHIAKLHWVILLSIFIKKYETIYYFASCLRAKAQEAVILLCNVYL